MDPEQYVLSSNKGEFAKQAEASEYQMHTVQRWLEKQEDILRVTENWQDESVFKSAYYSCEGSKYNS